MKLKLKDESETHVLNKAQFHAQALRAIGQDLTNLFPQTLEIALHGMTFQVNGQYLPRDPGGKGAQGSSQLLDKLRSKLLRDQPTVPPAEDSTVPISFDRTYTPVDIDRMDESAANRRNEIDKVPDIYSLGEMLRMVGRIVDSNGRRLLNLSRDMYGVTFEYEDGAGQTQKREFSNLQLYKLQQQYYAERGTYVPIDNWKGSF
ncbi:MAG TPA: hypothetical protein VGB27_13710 [Candidatus Binatia bacterium]